MYRRTPEGSLGVEGIANNGCQVTWASKAMEITKEPAKEGVLLYYDQTMDLPVQLGKMKHVQEVLVGPYRRHYLLLRGQQIKGMYIDSETRNL